MKNSKSLTEKVNETAKEEFPKLIEYLEKEYGKLAIEEPKDDTLPKQWGLTKDGELIGFVKEYCTRTSAVTEDGYKAEIRTNGKRVSLKFVKFYIFTDPNNGETIYLESKRRYDTEKAPFP